MKSVEILIPNHDVGPVIELNIESIRARTNYPHYSIIVHDDSTEGIDYRGSDAPHTDRAYLEKIEAQGWIRLIRSTTRKRWEKDKANFAPGHPAPYYHGCALNVLINETCRADYAMLLDCDVFITDRTWLSRMIAFMDDETLVASHEWQPGWRQSGFYVPGWCRPTFLMLNMAAYHDGMEVDWRGGSSTIDREPFKTLLAMGLSGERDTPTCNNGVAFDPGSSLWAKLKVDNPKHYKSVNLPREMELKYHHFNNGSLRSLFPKERELVDKELALIRRRA